MAALEPKRFLKRYRKTIVVGAFAGLFVAGGIKLHGIYHSALDRLNEMDTKVKHYKNRQDHFERVSRESSQALLCFISSLNDALEKQFCEIKSILSDIKVLRAQRKDGESKDKEHTQWDQLKTLSFSKLIVGVYAFNVVHLVLRVQLHILGRYNFNSQPLATEDMKLFLSDTFTFLYEKALHQFCDDVRTITQEILKDISVSKVIEYKQMIELMKSINDRIEKENTLNNFIQNSFQDNASITSLSSSLLKASTTNQQLSLMLDELFDVIESPYFLETCQHSVKLTFSIVFDQLNLTIFQQQNKHLNDENHCNQNVSTEKNVIKTPCREEDCSPQIKEHTKSSNPIGKPLPILLTKLKTDKTIFCIDYDRGVASSRHADAVAELPCVQVLCDAVFGCKETNEFMSPISI